MKNFVVYTILFWFVVPTASATDEKLVESQPIKHRVTGLFSPDREADLRRVLKENLPDVKVASIDFRNAEATFLYDADKLFNRPKPEQLPERFDNLLRSVSNSTFGIRPLCTTPKEKLKFVEIGIVGLDCKGCCLGAYEAIYRLDGVEQATASFRDGLVTAWIDPKKTNRETLEEALKKRNVQLTSAGAD